MGTQEKYIWIIKIETDHIFKLKNNNNKIFKKITIK